MLRSAHKILSNFILPLEFRVHILLKVKKWRLTKFKLNKVTQFINKVQMYTREF